MGFKSKFIRDRKFVLTLITDGADDAQLADIVRSITRETQNMHPFVELADASELHDTSGLTAMGAALAGSLEYDRQHFKQDKLAILVASNETYELANQYASTSSYFRYGVKIFRDFNEAIKWLGVADLEKQINELRRAG